VQKYRYSAPAFCSGGKVELHQVHINWHKDHIAQPFRKANVEATPEILRVFRKDGNIEVRRNIQSK
jgi:hypothetical protein